MAWARERVVPPAGKGAWLRYGGLGCAAGAVYGLVLPWLFFYALEHIAFAVRHTVAAIWTIDVLLCTLALAPLILLLRVTQRWDALLGFSFAFILMLGAVSEGVDVLKRPDGGADVMDWLDGDLLATLGVTIPGFLVVAAILRTLGRVLVVRTIEQGPDDCAWCGYTRGSEAIVRCPECGREAAHARYRMHGFVAGATALARWWRIPTVCAGVLILALSVHPLAARTLPSFRFFRAFPAGQRIDAAYQISHVMPGLPMIWIPHPTRDDRGLRATFEPARGERPERLGIDVTGTPATGLSHGAGRVFADLDTAQTEDALKHGLPKDLVDALYAKAEEIAWMPASAARGAWKVDPTPFFPR